MKKYLAVYLGSMDAIKEWDSMEEKARKQREAEGIQAWSAWGEKNNKAILQLGSPLGKTKKVGPKGISDTKNALTAWTLVEAESHEAACKMFQNHPHFSIFPGDSIEVMECLEIPVKK